MTIVALLLLALGVVFRSGRGTALLLYQKATNTCLPLIYMQNEIIKENKLQCVMECELDPNCQGVCYEKDEFICRTFHTDWNTASSLSVITEGFEMHWADYSGYVRFGNKGYRNSPVPRSWDDARRNCQSENADLALPMNKGEDEFIAKLGFLQQKLILPNDRYQEGVWVIGDTGRNLSYTNWEVNEPGIDSTVNSAIVHTNFKWYDVNGLNGRYYVCEKAIL